MKIPRVNPVLLALLGGAVALWIFSKTSGGSTVIQEVTDAALMSRGLRNNNPGNIRHTADVWQGMSPVQGDANFVTFVDPVHGLRAMAIILAGYLDKNFITIRDIINRWSPASDNSVSNTNAYVDAVVASTGLPPDLQLTAADLPVLMQAITLQENGSQPYAPALFAQAISLAGVA